MGEVAVELPQAHGLDLGHPLLGEVGEAGIDHAQIGRPRVVGEVARGEIDGRELVAQIR